MKRALVLVGGGLAGIAWETGVLRGIADESPAMAKALLASDVLVGTSAGSTVAAQLGSGLDLDALFVDDLLGAVELQLVRADLPWRRTSGNIDPVVTHTNSELRDTP